MIILWFLLKKDKINLPHFLNIIKAIFPINQTAIIITIKNMNNREIGSSSLSSTFKNESRKMEYFYYSLKILSK